TRAEASKFQRVRVSILGRYMLADRREFPCQVLEMSPGDAVVVAPVAGIAGERVIAYLDLIGRVEGTILEQVDGGFLMDVAASRAWCRISATPPSCSTMVAAIIARSSISRSRALPSSSTSARQWARR